MSRIGVAPRAAVPAPGASTPSTAASKTRAEASRRNGAKSRGPRTPEGKARSSKNALRHGLRAQKYVVLPQEDAAEFAALERALLAELAPVGALQIVLAQRIAAAAWRLARADRMETEVLELRSYEGANPGIALVRDGNGTRAFETLMRYRSAAMAELMRALRTLQALQAEQAVAHSADTDPAARSRARKFGGRLAGPAATERSRRLAPPRPNEPESARDDGLHANAAMIATRPTARGTTTGTQAGPEPSLASLIRPALELLGAGTARDGQTNLRSSLQSSA